MRKKTSARVERILSLLDPKLRTFDLCSDLGLIGREALMQDKVQHVTFVEIKPHLIEDTKERIANLSVMERASFIQADVLQYSFPEEASNFIIAGVGTNLIISFLSNFRRKSGDVIVCHTHQNIARFERKLLELSWIPTGTFDVKVGNRDERIWVFRP
ncbi:MAG: SAM-dependent methyltransferase [Pseudomonadota bacterium]